MTIGELIEVLDPAREYHIESQETGEIIAEYNGKNSIPNYLNPCEVWRLSYDVRFGFVIEI